MYITEEMKRPQRSCWGRSGREQKLLVDFTKGFDYNIFNE